VPANITNEVEPLGDTWIYSFINLSQSKKAFWSQDLVLL